MKKVFAVLITVVLFAGCTSNPGQSISSAGGEVLSATENTSAVESTSAAESISASSDQNDSDEKTAYTVEEMQAFFVQLEEYARTGDIRLLDHLSFKDERNYAGMKAILEDEAARELWCAAFAPTVWRFPELTRDVDFSRTDRLATYIKSPVWMYVDTLHTALSGCAPLNNTPDALKSYFAEYADVIPYRYSAIDIQYADGALTLEGESFVKWYVKNRGGDDILSKAVNDPIESFTDFIDMHAYTTDLPELTEEEKLLTEYYKLVADNRFFEAIDLMEGTSLGMQGSDTLNELVALTDEQKAKLQAELDKLPKGEFYQYSMIGAKDRLEVYGVLISYGLAYDKNFDIFGEGLPIPVKKLTFCYFNTDKPSIEHFPAIYNIMRNMEL